MQGLFDAIREACGPGIWSRGIGLARADAVTGESAEDHHVVLQVARQGGRRTARVELFPGDEEWDCDCDGPDDPCEHVAAAVIAWRRAREQGQTLPADDRSVARLGYRFARQGTSLAFSRVFTLDGRDVPLRGSLIAVGSGKVDGPRFIATGEDEFVDGLMIGRNEGMLAPPVMARLIAALAFCDDVRVDGKPVRASGEPVLPLAVVEDRGDGFAVRISADETVTEVFQNAAALCGDVLRPLGDVLLTARERDHGLDGEYFPPDEAARLVAEVIPDLQARLPVRIDTQRLPEVTRTPPRLRVTVRRDGDALVVRPEIVYGDPPTARVEGGRLVPLGGPLPVRDAGNEARLRVAARRELGMPPGGSITLSAADAIDFAPRLAAFASGDVEGDAHRGFFAAEPLEPALAGDAEGFALEFRSGAGRVDAARVLGAWRDGASLVPLSGGGFAPLPADWLARHGQRVADLLAARDATGALPACALPDLARLHADLGEPPPPGFERLRALLDDFDGLPAADLPTDLHAELRGYQERGVRWLGFLREAGLGGLLADDMGLGKTLQALCAVRGRTLVVAPTSVLFGWAEQAARFRPGLRVSLYHGAGRALDPDADLTLTSYAILRLDAEALCAVDWDSVVLDEAQAIKNPESQVARAAWRLRGELRLTLTGTPVENRLDELWSQMRFLNPGLLGTREDFRARYARPIAEGAADAAAHLRERMRPFVLRRLKADVAPELPPRTEAVLHVELDAEERAVYDTVRAATRADVVARLRAGGSVIQALEALLRLRQAACHAALVPGQHATRSSKVDVLLERLDEAVAEGHKALVFSQWTALLDRVEPHLRDADLRYTRLDGSTKDRAGVVESFQSADGPPVLLISLRAGGTGLNLTAADHVFLLDPWWNPAVEAQAADRAHRIGQERPVSVYRLVTRDSVEERILALQESKRALAEAALGAADGAVSITRDDLIALLD